MHIIGERLVMVFFLKWTLVETDVPRMMCVYLSTIPSAVKPFFELDLARI